MANDEQPAAHPGRSHEFVVALPYGPAVASMLRHGFDMACDLTESRPLNLSLVRPERLDEFAARLREAARERRARPDHGRVLTVVHGSEPGTSALDDLMFCVRYDFAARCDGWFPQMGKNRDVHNVTGQPHLDGGAVDYPVAVGPPQPPHALGHHRGAGVRVGILDTKLAHHADLAGRYLAEPADLLDPQSVHPYLAGHATFISGLVLRRAPGAELAVRHALNEERATATVWDVVHRMLELRTAGVQILNLSLGCYTADGQPPMVLAHAVRLLAPDVVIVAAAGNHGDPSERTTPSDGPAPTPRSAFWPAAMDEVVAVGADTGYRNGTATLAPFSPRLPWIGLTAEGKDVVSTYLDGQVDVGQGRRTPTRFSGYASWSGTSFAAATVTGELAALIRPGAPVWQAVADLREHARLKPDDGVRTYTFDATTPVAG